MKLIKYLLQYRFKDMGELIRNGDKDPQFCAEDMTGKTVVITGATNGIGLETAHLLAQKGASLIMLNRNPVKSQELEKEIKEKYGTSVRTILVDFGSLDQVRRAGEELISLKEPIDVLIHNAGVYHTRRTLSSDGVEIVFQVNHLSSFLLNHLLLQKLKKENRARIIHVNSEGHRFALAGVHIKDLFWRWHRYGGLKSYGAAKTAQLLCLTKFKEFFESSRVTVNAMHPGNVVTNIGNNNGRLYRYLKEKLVLSSAKTPDISARALYYLAASPEVAGVTGKFFNLTTEEKPAPHARDPKAVEPVWKKSLELCGLV